jgi:hypothetical protein
MSRHVVFKLKSIKRVRRGSVQIIIIFTYYDKNLFKNLNILRSKLNYLALLMLIYVHEMLGLVFKISETTCFKHNYWNRNMNYIVNKKKNVVHFQRPLILR